MREKIWLLPIRRWRASLLVVSLVLGWAVFAVGFEQSRTIALGDEETTTSERIESEGESIRDSKGNEVLNFTPHPDLATLYIVRGKSIKGAAVKSKIYLNGKFAGQIGNGRYAVFHLTPGEYVIGVEPENNKRSLKMRLDPGQLYHAKIKMKLGLFSLSAKSGRAKVEHIDDAQAQELIRELEPVEPWKYY